MTLLHSGTLIVEDFGKLELARVNSFATGKPGDEIVDLWILTYFTSRDEFGVNEIRALVRDPR